MKILFSHENLPVFALISSQPECPPHERSVCTLLLRKNRNLSQLQLQEHIYTINFKEEGETGSATTRFMGRGTRTGLPNSWEHFVDCQKQVHRRGELKERRVQKEERTVGKETYSEGERVRIQDIKSKLWNLEGIVKGVRTADN